MKEHNQFRLRLNLFDGIVLVLALAAAVFLLWRFTRPAAVSGDGVSSASVQYTVRSSAGQPGPPRPSTRGTSWPTTSKITTWAPWSAPRPSPARVWSWTR